MISDQVLTLDLTALLNNKVISDACARLNRCDEPEKQYFKCLLKLCNWLANSKPPTTTEDWIGLNHTLFSPD